MSTATTSPPSAPSAESPPSSKQPTTATTSNGKHLLIHPKKAPVIPLSRGLSSACQRLHSAATSAYAERLQPLNKPNFQNPKNQPFPLNGMINVFKGFSHHLSSLISKNPLFAGNNRRENCLHGGGGGGGGRNHNVLSQIFCPPAIAKVDKNAQNWDSHDLPANLVVQLNNLSREKRYKISGVKFLNPRNRSVVDGADESFGDLVELQPGGIYTKTELTEKLQALSSSGLFEKIEFDAKTNPDGSVDINIPYKEYIYPSKTKFRCVSVGSLPEFKPIEMDPNMTEKGRYEYIYRMNKQYKDRIDNAKGCILPGNVEEEIESMLSQRSNLSASLLRKIVGKVQKWYRDNAYYGARIVGMSNPESNEGGEITFELMEGEIKKLGVRFEDKMGNICEGNTNIGVIKRALPEEIAIGKAYNKRAFDKAIQNLGSLKLFSNIKVNPEQDEENGAVSAEFVLQEPQWRWYNVATSWNIVPGRNQRPTLASLRPGTEITFGRQNIKGLNRSLQGAIHLSNLFAPQDAFDFNFEYAHPYLDGIDNPRNRTFHAACFKTRKLSPVFRGGPGIDDSPIWVDRVGAKAMITEDYTKQSRFAYGLVMEDVKTRGEGGDIVPRGDRLSSNGLSIGDGPPTTLSGTGVDRMAFLQANLTRDNTKFVNGAVVGERDVFQVDQGLGIGGIFNRHKLSISRFIPLKKVEEGKGKAPPVLALHGIYGGCVGDLPNHEAFTIGGPHSVRGYDFGEIGASRNKVEVSAEIRMPVKKDTYVYAFGDHGNDLGSSIGVQGNPTKSYMRRGHGSSYGAGIKFDQLRAECAVNHNTGKCGFSINFGDRF